MDGPRVNAKVKQVGFLSAILREENEFLQARWAYFSNLSCWVGFDPVNFDHTCSYLDRHRIV